MFLNILKYEKNRKLPLNYKFTQIDDFLIETKKNKECKIEIYDTNSYEPNLFHKPISKL